MQDKVEYYAVGIDGVPRGPVDLATLNAWSLEGHITADTSIETAGTGERMSASQIEGLHLTGVSAPATDAQNPDQTVYTAYPRPKQIPFPPPPPDSYIKSAKFMGWLAIGFSVVPVFIYPGIGILTSLTGLSLTKRAEKAGYLKVKRTRILNYVALSIACVTFVIGIFLFADVMMSND
jgi:hypothetical protein